MAKVRKTKADTKKKQWVELYAPDYLNGQLLGETYVSEPEKAVGKRLTLNLMTLLRDMKKQGMAVTFTVTGRKEGKMITEATSFHMLNSSLKRLIRRNKNKIVDSFTCETADGRTVRVKPFVKTRSRTVKPVQSKIRAAAKEFLVAHIKKTTSGKLFHTLMLRQLQREMYTALKKLYPLSSCEIRMLSIVQKRDFGAEVKEEVPSDDVSDEGPKEVVEETPVEEASGEAEAEVPAQEEPASDVAGEAAQ